jgi:AcrR family transcriptional regulator
MGIAWGRHDYTESAVDRILGAAETLYVREGYDATTMAQVAAEAGCSRATLYNYFPNKRELRTALRNRAAIAIAAEATESVAHLTDPAARMTEAMITAIHRVRATPALATWFTGENLALTSELAQSSEVIDAIAMAFAQDLRISDAGPPHVRARLIIRIIISFLSAPEVDEAHERTLIECMAAGLTQGPTTGSVRTRRA